MPGTGSHKTTNGPVRRRIWGNWNTDSSTTTHVCSSDEGVRFLIAFRLAESQRSPLKSNTRVPDARNSPMNGDDPEPANETVDGDLGSARREASRLSNEPGPVSSPDHQHRLSFRA
jgi:hypothetical protein